MARALGIEVKSATLRPRISGQLQRSPDSPSGFRIRVNRHEAATRQRFTIAHEIAHYLLHRDYIGDGIEDSILYRSTLSDAREAEANRLGAQLLMPEKSVIRVLREYGGIATPEIARIMAERYDVSEVAMGIRLGLG
ncbi:ImmA/IrrE family metallo-endopeptidase [Acidimangrovimonas sediminis]|uniref:ImmA/IrrE family metallo-endopeptidase n=2 Tax=Albidovulum sediminis TaxID=3066345 RepID=A0ABT2NG82_9RHOB|nr:ImmA/IrrE family metallo-endopeptidase [Defluviimonas sediminis]MCT8327925.1 ImmA/IrrE family metallo-endopeptidase [Defluviimonas sediminis]